MTPEQMRELADNLEPMAAAPVFDRIDIPGAVALLRQCAEQRPVHRLAETDIYDFAGWLTTREGVMSVGSTSDAWPMAEAVGEYIRKFPERFAAPQAEPCIGNDSACPCQDGDACHYKDAADGTKAWPVPQAEPKREPLSDERLREVLIAEARRIARDFGEPNPESLSVIDEGMLAEVMRAGRAVERAHGIGGSDE